VTARPESGNPASTPEQVEGVAAGSDVVESDPAGKGRAGVFARLTRLLESRIVRLGFLVAVVALLAAALADQGPKLYHDVQHLSLGVVALALAASLVSLFASLMVWRTAIGDLGSPLSIGDACRVMFIGQLAKYIPGSVWPVFAQMELGADRGIPRGRSAVSVLVSYAVMVTTGGMIAAVVLPLAGNGAISSHLWAIAAVPLGILVLCPPVLNRLLALLLRVLRRKPLDGAASWRGVAMCIGWAAVVWAANGAMTYLLLARLAGHRGELVLLAVGGFALSWVAGFLAVFAPAGAGVREVVLIGVLSSRTSAAAALTVALVTRGLVVVSDAIAGSAAGLLVGRHRLHELRRRKGDAAQILDAEPGSPLG
jgi:glycosyltransferase 2 family protein